MKYRIIKNGNLFYAQKKYFFWWITLSHSYSVGIDGSYSDEFDFKKLEDAKNFIKKHSLEQIKKVVWEI